MGALASFYREDAINHQVAEQLIEGRDAIREMFAVGFASAKMVCLIENVFEDRYLRPELDDLIAFVRTGTRRQPRLCRCRRSTARWFHRPRRPNGRPNPLRTAVAKAGRLARRNRKAAGAVARSACRTVNCPDHSAA